MLAKENPLAKRRPVNLPCTDCSAKGGKPRPSVALTSVSDTSATAPSSAPPRTSAHQRRAPLPWASSVPRSPGRKWRRNCDTSTRGKSAYTCPAHSCHKPLRRTNKGWRNWPTTLKRAPQSSGGVASNRTAWRRGLLRSTTSTSCKASRGADRNASVHMISPPRTAISFCENNQSAACPPPPASSCDKSRPATKMRPSALRRTSSRGWWMVICSNPLRQSDVGDSVASTRDRCTASRPSGPLTDTSCNVNEGTTPSERAEMSPMCTGTPKALLACLSSCGRNSPIRGTIQPCKAPQPARSSRETANTTQKIHCAKAAYKRSRREGVGVESFMSDLKVAGIMICSAPRGSRTPCVAVFIVERASPWMPR